MRVPCFVHNSYSHRHHAEQPFIPGVGSNQPRLQTTFQRPGKHQAKRRSQIPRQIKQKRGVVADLQHIQHAVDPAQQNQDRRQPDRLSPLAPAALEQHQPHSGQCAQPHAARCDEISRAVGIFPVRPDHGICRKGKHELVKIVGEHQQHQRSHRQIEQLRPARQPIIFRLAQRGGDEHREERNQQHRQVIAIPKKTHRVCIGHKQELDGSLRHPEYHQHGNRGQQSPHLRLHDAPAHRNTPIRQQSNINHAAHQAQRAPRHAPPIFRHKIAVTMQRAIVHAPRSICLLARSMPFPAFFPSLPYPASLYLLCRIPSMCAYLQGMVWILFSRSKECTQSVLR